LGFDLGYPLEIYYILNTPSHRAKLLLL